MEPDTKENMVLELLGRGAPLCHPQTSNMSQSKKQIPSDELLKSEGSRTRLQIKA